jgi:hypothetical protein
MRPTRWLVGAVTAVTVAAPMSITTTPADAAAQASPRIIHLPRGWRPEGITTDGRSIYSGSLRNGAIFKVNPRTGNGHLLARGQAGRVAVGIDYDARRDLLWVAGGATGHIRAHDADTGRVVARYSFGGGRFLNDITVTRRGVFATDSFSDQLAVVPLRGRSLPPLRRAHAMTLTGDFHPVAGQFNLNGIVHTRHRLLAVQSVNGRLFRINARTGATHRVRVHHATLTGGDGLELHNGVLYVVRGIGRVVALDLSPRLRHAFKIRRMSRPSLDVPTTAAALRGRLFVVNARFNTTPTAHTRYWITRMLEVRP